MQKLKDLLGGSKEDMRTRSGSNTSAESFANNVCTGGGGVKVMTDPKGFLAVPGILRVSLTLFVSRFDQEVVTDRTFVLTQMFGRTSTVRFGPNDRTFFCRTQNFFFRNTYIQYQWHPFIFFVLLNDPHIRGVTIGL